MFNLKNIFGLYKGDGVTTFHSGSPGQEALEKCQDIMKEASAIHLANEKPEDLFQYGPEPGDPDFREQLATFLTQTYKTKVLSTNLMVTTGATNGFHFISTLMFDNNSPVFVEDPTYSRILEILEKDLGRTIISVPRDEEGIDVDILDALLTQFHSLTDESKLKSKFWALVYLIPTLHNPTSTSTSPERCQQLIKVARKHKVLLFCDDVYNLLCFEDNGPAWRLFSYDEKTDEDYDGNVLSNGSFSKIFSPGLRLGWIEASDYVLNFILSRSLLQSSGGLNQYTSGIMTTVLRNGHLQTHLKFIRDMLQKRIKLLTNILRKHLPPEFIFHEPNGGSYIWLQLPESLDGEAILPSAEQKHKVSYRPGSRCSYAKNFKNFIRISVSFCEEELLAPGALRLCRYLEECWKDKS